MHYTDITTQIMDEGLRERAGATPAPSVAATICMSRRDEGSASPFLRVARGEYILRAFAETQISEPIARQTVSADTVGLEEDDISTSIIHAFGMYWQRELVRWNSSCVLLGRQQFGGRPGRLRRSKRSLSSARQSRSRLCRTHIRTATRP
ncbi:MAG: HTH domain-containing protein [Planctomycetaceae bacterium]